MAAAAVVEQTQFIEAESEYIYYHIEEGFWEYDRFQDNVLYARHEAEPHSPYIYSVDPIDVFSTAYITQPHARYAKLFYKTLANSNFVTAQRSYQHLTIVKIWTRKPLTLAEMFTIEVEWGEGSRGPPRQASERQAIAGREHVVQPEDIITIDFVNYTTDDNILFSSELAAPFLVERPTEANPNGKANSIADGRRILPIPPPIIQPPSQEVLASWNNNQKAQYRAARSKQVEYENQLNSPTNQFLITTEIQPSYGRPLKYQTMRKGVATQVGI